MGKMKIKLSDHFTYGKLLRFTFPSVVMMVFTSLYSVVDGLFVANLVGDLALSAVNIIFPVAMIIGAFGFMLGTGGSAIVARTLGEKKKELADPLLFYVYPLCGYIGGGPLSCVRDIGGANLTADRGQRPFDWGLRHLWPHPAGGQCALYAPD